VQIYAKNAPKLAGAPPAPVDGAYALPLDRLAAMVVGPTSKGDERGKGGEMGRKGRGMEFPQSQSE